MDISMQITFGIETEFIVAYKPQNFADRVSPELETSVYNNIITILREAGFSVNPFGAKTNYSNWTVDIDFSIKAEPQNVHLPGWMDHEFLGVELKSPIFFFSDRAAAFQQLSAAFQLIQLQYHVFTNSSCGLHVHVGNRGLGFPRQTLKTFAQMVVVFERQLESLHPRHRLNNPHCLAPGSNFPSSNLTKNVRLIQQAQSTAAIVYQMSCKPEGHRRGFAYNLSNLRDEEVMPKPTIEFRQHEGTLEVEAIAAWVSLACGLVERCYRMTREQVEPMLLEGIRNPSITIADLLVELGMSNVAEYYRPRGWHEHPQPLQEMPTDQCLPSVGVSQVDVDMGDDTDSDLSSVDDLEDDDEVFHPSEVQQRRSQTTKTPRNSPRGTRPGPTTCAPSAAHHPDTSGDAEIARQLALNLRPRAARFRRLQNPAGNTPDSEDWETYYAVHEPLVGLLVDDDEDSDYD